MKLVLSAAAAVTALGLAAGTASAQYPALVPHRGHYHVVPSHQPPAFGGYGYPAYSPGVTFGGAYSTPGFGGGLGYTSPGFGYGGGVYPAPFPYSGGYGWGGHHRHHHHGHHHR
ncbi:MAG: spore coat protein [Isosphaera sp.]|nr:spore coat protein [Isosphaera sp.]